MNTENTDEDKNVFLLPICVVCVICGYSPLTGMTIVCPAGDFSFTRTPSGQCSAEVSLEWDNAIYVGRAIGQSSPLVIASPPLPVP